VAAPVLQLRVSENTLARIGDARGADTRSAWCSSSSTANSLTASRRGLCCRTHAGLPATVKSIQSPLPARHGGTLVVHTERSRGPCSYCKFL
jgi:hypothetical protein